MRVRALGAVSLLYFVATLLPAIPASAQEKPPPAKTLKAFDPKLMDTSVDPCVSLYQYSCGGWLKQNPIPADESSYGRANEIIDENQLVLKTILEKAAAGGSERSSNEQKIGDYYATCMNVDAVDKAGFTPLQPLLDRVAALTSKNQFPELAAYFDGIGVNTFFALGLSLIHISRHPAIKPRVIRHFEPWMALSFTEGSIGGDIERVDLKKLEAFYGGHKDVASLQEQPEQEPGGSNGIAIAPSNTALHLSLIHI